MSLQPSSQVFYTLESIALQLKEKEIHTEFYFTVNFRSLMNFICLRTHPAAQYEIRQYAEAIRDMTRPRIPLCFEAYESHVLAKEDR